MNAEKLIKAACAMQGVSIAELAVKMGTSQQNFAKRCKNGRFDLAEWDKIAAALGLQFNLSFTNLEENTVISYNGTDNNK